MKARIPPKIPKQLKQEAERIAKSAYEHARSVKHQIATVTAESRRIGFSIVVATRLFGRFGLSGGERLTIGTAAGYRRKDGNQ